MTGADTPDLDEIGAMSEDELLLCLGQESAGEAAVPQSLGTLIDKGREILDDLEPRLRSALCDADGPKAILKTLSDKARDGAVTALIATAGTTLTQMAAIYVGAILVRRGLDVYCAAAGPSKAPKNSDLAAT